MAAPRALILCKSVHHGNTLVVAKTIGEMLAAQVTMPEAVPYSGLHGHQLVGFGSGVFYGRLHPAIHDWLQGLPDAPETTIPAFVFSTSGLPWLSRIWHRSLRHLLARKGFRVIGEFSCRGFDTWGPLRLVGGLNRNHPDARDLDRARRFAADIAGEPWSHRAAARCA